MLTFTINGVKLEVTYNGASVVTVHPNGTFNDYHETLKAMDKLLSNFNMSYSGSYWGCDGEGFVVERSRNNPYRHMSGVGPRNFTKGCKKASNPDGN